MVSLRLCGYCTLIIRDIGNRDAHLVHNHPPVVQGSLLVLEMGGQASVATICPAFDEPVVCAGQNVTGRVYLSVIQGEVNCLSIGCRVSGQELTAVTYTKPSSDGKQSTHLAVEKRRFMDMRICLHNTAEGVLRCGHYEFPFVFTMPATAPATTYAGDPAHCGYINYTLEVWLDRPGSLRWDIRGKSTVIVAPPPAVYARTPMYIQPQSLDLRSLLFFDRGSVFLGWQAESDVTQAGETMIVKFGVANFTRVRFLEVEVKLTQHANVNANGKRGSTKTRLFWTHFSGAFLNRAVPLMPSDKEVALRQLGDAVRGEDPKNPTPTFTVRMPVPPDTAPSHQNGDRVQIRHELKVKLWTTTGTNNLRWTQQIRVVNPAPMYIPERWLRSDKCGPALQLPTNWAPHIEPVAVLPEIPVDMGALSRPAVKEIEGAPFQYAATAQVTPVGYPVIGVENPAALDCSAAWAPPAADYSCYEQAEASPYVDGDGGVASSVSLDRAAWGRDKA
jgi:hypothetical protein